MKENQRIAVTKRMLKEGLLRLLDTKPLDKVRVNELCAESGINRATFYRHYESPQDVLFELEMDILKQIVPSVSPQNTEEAKKQLIHACEFIYENAAIAKTLFRCNTDVDLMNGLNRFYKEYLELRKAESQFAQMDDATAEVVVALLGGGCYCLLRQWILEDIPKTPQQIADILCSLIRWPDSPDFLQGT